jgi:hypothetical protein
MSTAKEPNLARQRFYQRMIEHGFAAVLVMLFSLSLGILGYHNICGLSLVDSLLNASMILGVIGPVNPIETIPGNRFAAFYDLFSGVIFLVVSAILIAPLAHTILYYLHLEADDEQARGRQYDDLVCKT